MRQKWWNAFRGAWVGGVPAAGCPRAWHRRRAAKASLACRSCQAGCREPRRAASLAAIDEALATLSDASPPVRPRYDALTPSSACDGPRDAHGISMDDRTPATAGDWTPENSAASANAGRARARARAERKDIGKLRWEGELRVRGTRRWRRCRWRTGTRRAPVPWRAASGSTRPIAPPAQPARLGFVAIVSPPLRSRRGAAPNARPFASVAEHQLVARAELADDALGRGRRRRARGRRGDGDATARCGRGR